jgi:hypothetical protein
MESVNLNISRPSTLSVSIQMNALYITKGISRFSDLNVVQKVLEVTDFKPMVIKQMKFFKNTVLPLVMPHIRTKLDNTENNKRIIPIMLHFYFCGKISTAKAACSISR